MACGAVGYPPGHRLMLRVVVQKGDSASRGVAGVHDVLVAAWFQRQGPVPEEKRSVYHD